MKNTKLFQYIVIGLFVFFIIVGAVLFATYKSKDKNTSDINITVWGTLPLDGFSTFISKFFEASQLKYKVNYVERDPATFDRDLVEALASRVGPDAIILPEDLIIRYSKRIYTIPYSILSQLQFKQTFIQEGELYLTTDGVLALPFSVDPLIMYWNRDIFNNFGVTKPPVTWAEISSLTSKMTKKDQAKNILSSTVALGEFRNINNAKEIITSLIMQAGNPIVTIDSNGAYKSVVDTGTGSKTFPVSASIQFFTNFSNPNKVEYSWNRSLPNSLDVFSNGDLAMYFGFASEYAKIKNKNPNLNFDVAPLPQSLLATTKTYSTFGNMLGLAIMKNSANPAGVYTVISALTSAQAYPFWTDIFNIPSARRDILGQAEKKPAKAVFNSSAIMSKGWYDPSTAETSVIFQEMVESYTTGRESMATAITAASGQLDNLLYIK